MSKVFIEETTLTNIGSAIREKTGKSDLIAPGDMPAEIRGIVSGGGGDIEIEPIVLTAECQYALQGKIGSVMMKNFSDKISTKDMTGCYYMFASNDTTTIPFDINLSTNFSGSLAYMFFNCTKLEYIPNITYTNLTKYIEMGSMFQSCNSLRYAPYIYNCYPGNLSYLFRSCKNLREIPDDYFATWNFDRLKTYQYGNTSNMFYGCEKLRKVPQSLLNGLEGMYTSTSHTSSLYCAFVRECYRLDELVNLPVVHSNMNYNMFSDINKSCFRLKGFIFKTNNDNTPLIASWKSQTIDLSGNGYFSEASMMIDSESGITEDKEIKDDATYQALKNDVNSFVTNIDYSRYNRTSAVETINSLPDTTEYLATKGGTNTIKFRGAAGAKTDGGAINTMTEAEIAIATAKGWSVTFS